MAKGSALITGASGGIGREIARQLAAAGLTVYAGSRDRERGQRAVTEIGGGARLLVLDVTDGASIAGAAGRIEELDILVNNARIMVDGRAAPEADVDSFRRTYETNVFGVVAVTNAFLPALRRSAHPRIVNVSSGTGSLAWSTGPNPQFDYQTGGTGAAALPRRTSRRRPVLNSLEESLARYGQRPRVKSNRWSTVDKSRETVR